ncbi:MAG: lipid IV(A) 3-deoxy-D-manno-octulosonic acid transferase [Woeseiaceae bacterium]
MSLLYNLLTYLLLIPYACYWLFRSLGNRDYLTNLGQRFGFGFPRLQRCIWIHAVSVGEVQAAIPLINHLRKQYPHRQLLVTTVTLTGAARVRAVFGEAVQHSYIPFEFPHAVALFFRHVDPAAALIMETEIWPNIYRGCGVRRVPLVLVSARISPRSIRGYRRLLPLIRETLSHGIIIAAQTPSDAERFLSLGASPRRTHVTGSIKFDIELPTAVIATGRSMRGDLLGDRAVWVAASTHEGEEKLLLQAHQALLKRFPRLLLILVPRHPERFAEVRGLIEKSGLKVVSRTEGKACSDSTSVLLGDTMGEVPLFYAMSDIAFIGGSLVPIGGHNLLEPAIQGLPLITGPHLFNSQDMADMFVESEAVRVVSNKDELVGAVAELLDRPEYAAELGQNALELLQANRGALQRLLLLLEPLLIEKLPA